MASGEPFSWLENPPSGCGWQVGPETRVFPYSFRDKDAERYLGVHMLSEGGTVFEKLLSIPPAVCLILSVKYPLVRHTSPRGRGPSVRL